MSSPTGKDRCAVPVGSENDGLNRPAGSLLQVQSGELLYGGWSYKCQDRNTELVTCSDQVKVRFRQSDAWLSPVMINYLLSAYYVPTTDFTTCPQVLLTWPRARFPFALYSVSGRLSASFWKCFQLYMCAAVATNFTHFGCQFFMTKGHVLGILRKGVCVKGLAA